jgi:hypothetical protein
VEGTVPEYYEPNFLQKWLTAQIAEGELYLRTNDSKAKVGCHFLDCYLHVVCPHPFIAVPLSLCLWSKLERLQGDEYFTECATKMQRWRRLCVQRNKQKVENQMNAEENQRDWMSQAAELAHLEASKKAFKARYEQIVLRREIAAQHQKNSEAALVLQCAWRAKVSRNAFETLLQGRCAKMLQCAMRQKTARFELLSRKQKKAFALFKSKHLQTAR